MNESDPKNIVQLIAGHQTRLKALVRCLLVRPGDVDDLVQEINAVLWEKADDFDASTNFWAWASQIARYKVLNHVRKHSRERLLFDDEILGRLAEVAQRRLDASEPRREALADCLNRLPSAQRKLIDLRYTSGQTIEAIAKSVRRPAGSVRQTLYRVRSALLACIESKLSLEGDV